MLFNSLDFFVFFPLVVTAYFLTPQRWRWSIIVLSSYYFYMTFMYEYVFLLAASTLWDYFMGRLIGSAVDQHKRKVFLLCSITFNLTLLAVFKYFNFFSESIRQLFDAFGVTLNTPISYLALPIGISFYTFQSLSYTLDVYHKRIEPYVHFGRFAAYLSFFPQLVAGPIERATHLLPQFTEQHLFDYGRVTSGLSRMLLGFFKKVVIADRLALVVDLVYNSPQDHSGVTFIIATVLFAFQLYCDFSGYSDIAIGAARVLGFTLIENFKLPYSSKNISDFWRRWHISLSKWFNDYVFTPLYLHLSKKNIFNAASPEVRHIGTFFITILIAETLLGLWHGARWTYVVFGVYHGLLIGLYYLFRRTWDRMPVLAQSALTFSLVCVGFVFFRANTLSDATYIFTHTFPLNVSYTSLILPAVGWSKMLTMAIFVAILLAIHRVQSREQWIQSFHSKTIYVWSIYLLAILTILVFGIFTNASFIYFQF